MNEEVEELIREYANKAMEKQIKENLDSSLIFKYIDNLEKENNRLREYEKYYQKEINLLDNYIPKQKILDKIDALKETRLCGGAILEAVTDTEIKILLELLEEE